MDKTAIKNFAIEARKILMKSAIQEAGFYGITKEECKPPVQKGTDFEVYETLAGTENRIYGDDIKRRANLVSTIKEQGFDQVIEETAYTWFNRIIAIRFMEVNNYLPTRVRVLSSESGSGTPDVVTQSDTVELNLTSDEITKIQQAKADNKYDEAFRLLFIKQCNELNDILPGLFEKTNDYMELLLKLPYTSDGVVRLLVDSIPEDNFNVETEGQVEIIGWMYQYYISEKHEEVVDPLYGKSICKEDIPAATQLFTTDWVVRYLVDNSLGKYWIERNKNSLLANNLEFLDLKKIDYVDEKISPEELKVLDPCMGSAHFLVYAFEVLMQIYREEGYSDRDAAISILNNNIYGVDVDDRAYQMSYLALMMKARQYNRLIFRAKPSCRVFSIRESNYIVQQHIELLGQSFEDNLREEIKSEVINIVKLFKDAKEYGSLITIPAYDWDMIRKFISDYEKEGQFSITDIGIEITKQKLFELIEVAEVLSKKYHAVITNPPYLNKYDEKLKEYVFTNYKDYSGDLFSVFMYRNLLFTVDKGYSAYMTPNVWMFIVSYEKLRRFIIDNKSISTLIQMAKGAFFKEATVDVCAFVIKNDNKQNIGTYFRLEKYKGGMESQYEGLKQAIKNDDSSVIFETDKNNFDAIDGSPIAYWINNNVFSVFRESAQKVNFYAKSEGKNVTTKNAKYILNFWEVDANKIGAFDKKWLPCATGGDYRKWYGNIINVIDWSPDTRAFYKKAPAGRIIREEFWDMPGVTWGKISSAASSFRFLGRKQMYQETAILQNNENDSLFVLALLNSSASGYFLEFLSPTVNFQLQDICSIPIPKMENNTRKRIEELSKKCIDIARQDWDSFEISMDFKKHPLLNGKKKLSDAFESWNHTCELRFIELKNYEQEINQIIAECYGLQNEVEIEITDKSVSVHKADSSREIRSLISYAVGCMMGRYSLHEEGVINAGGSFRNFDDSIVDIDGILPIVDEEYFSDDITNKFINWLEIAFGSEYLDQNLNYIALNLGGKSENAKEILRNYFISDFYKEHVKTYQKRPIYWLVDSGKQNGFKGIFYLHRYTKDMIGVVRSEYLARTQTYIENSLRNAEYSALNSKTAVDKAQATKKRDKYVKQLAELKVFYQALYHVALEKIELNLDDGVKVNYAKFQGIEIISENGKKQTIDLLAKI